MSFSLDCDSKLPIVLFVGQHFSGSLFEWVHLSIWKRETTKGIRERDCCPYPCPLCFLPLAPSFLTHTLTRWGVGWTRKTVWTLYIPSMQGRLTLHVRRLVHISQVSGVFLKGQCQCSCTDILTKILMPCRYRKCFKRCWRYISLCGFNNNRFFDRLYARLYGGRCLYKAM